MSNLNFVKRFVLCLVLLSGILYVLMMAFLFFNLSTTTSEYSVGGVAAPHQFFYNFTHDRPFQSSLYASKGAGASVGFSYNPFAYIHIYVIHVYLTPFFFAPLWNLWPNLYWLYGLIFLVNYAGMAFFTWKIIKYLSPNSFKIKTAAAIGFLMFCGFLFVFQYKAQLLLFGAPFIMAAYYFLLTRQRSMFFVSMMLLCLISEDAAMVVVTFALYIYFFERGARAYAYVAGSFAIVYLAVVLLIVQPAARHDLVLTALATTIVVLKHIQNFFPPDLGKLIFEYLPVLLFLPAFGIVCLLFGKPKVSWVQVGGLVLIPPLPHWGECAVVGSGHHLMPVIVFMFAAFVLVLGRTPDIQPNGYTFSRQKAALLLGLSAIFLLGNLRFSSYNLPDQIRMPIYKLLGNREMMLKMEQNFAERRGNRRVIEVVERVPKENSLVFLTNCSVEGFITGRSDIWKFPDYYDSADYLVIQPNAHQAFFSFPTKGYRSFREALAEGRVATSDDAVISAEMTKAIVRYLVAEAKSHRVAVEEPEVILLERIKKHPINIPSTTIGFGWIQNVF